jgi:hypothetical protein
VRELPQGHRRDHGRADGIQFIPAGLTGSSGILAALRGGGFDFALIDSSNPARIANFCMLGSHTCLLGRVGVLPSSAAQRVTSTHSGTGTVWGNGANGTSGAGAVPVVLDCAKCHSPHGNGQYRILNTLAGEDWGSLAIPRWSAPVSAVEVADTANPSNQVRNYTVLPGDFASDVAGTYLPEQGDYWRSRAPWSDSGGLKDPM